MHPRGISDMMAAFPLIRWRLREVVVREVQAALQTDHCPELAESAILAIFPVCRPITPEAARAFATSRRLPAARAAADRASNPMTEQTPFQARVLTVWVAAVAAAQEAEAEL